MHIRAQEKVQEMHHPAKSDVSWVPITLQPKGHGNNWFFNPLSMEAKLAIAGLEDKKTGKLPTTVQMAIGMRAMILLNMATEADIANGT